MGALTEEHPRGTVQLRYDYAFGAVDNERAARSHIGNGAEVNVLNHRIEVLVFGIGTVQLQLRFQRYAVRQSAFETLVLAVTGRIHVIIDEFQHEVVTRIGYREVLHEHLVQPFVFAVLGRGI